MGYLALAMFIAISGIIISMYIIGKDEEIHSKS